MKCLELIQATLNKPTASERFISIASFKNPMLLGFAEINSNAKDKY